MEFLRNLSNRERLLILIAAGLVALFIALQGVVRPIAGWRADQDRALNEAEGLYELVNEAGAQSAGAAFAAGDSETPIRNALAQSASSAGVNLVYVNVRPDGGVDANIASVSPDRLFVWLQLVERNYGARVVTADIAREQSQPSMVRAQLTFARRDGAS